MTDPPPSLLPETRSVRAVHGPVGTLSHSKEGPLDGRWTGRGVEGPDVRSLLLTSSLVKFFTFRLQKVRLIVVLFGPTRRLGAPRNVSVFAPQDEARTLRSRQ